MGKPLHSPDDTTDEVLNVVHGGSRWSDLKQSRFLAWALLRRSLVSQYRRAALGYVWIFFPVLVLWGIWSFLRSHGVVSYEHDVSYPLYLLVGLLFWHAFVDALQGPMKAVSSAHSMLTKVRFPYDALLLAGLGEAVFNFLVRTLAFVPVIWWLGGFALVDVGAVLAHFVPLVLGGMALGVALSPIGLLYQDVERGMGLMLQIWFYLTPVVYALPAGRTADWLLILNPAAALFDGARNAALGLAVLHADIAIVWAAIGILALLASWSVFRVAMPVLIERLVE